MISVSNDIKVEFPEGVLNRKKIENIIISPIDNRHGVAVVSGKLKNMHLLRLYQIINGGEWDCYVPTHEIGAFTFTSRLKLMEFVKHLPEMTALEILMVMNPHPNLK
ncbi:hypothetical protein [Neobacillus vireti]|uniref:hypothetical protein n=1 Tax=Neobacillus vireti TaxID=220686 RepID=UPI0030009A05